MPDAIAKAIVAQVKRMKGCSLRNLYHALPDRYQLTDYGPEHFLYEPLVRLLKWNLIQAWDSGKLLDPQELAEGEGRTHSLRSRDLLISS